MVVALWTLAGLVPGILGFLIFQQWGPLPVVAFWVLASRMTREPKAAGIAGWVLPLLLVPVLNRYAASVVPPLAFVVGQTLPRAAMAVLAWIGRPAANAQLPKVTTLGAILSMLIALVPLVFAGRYGAILIVAASLMIRIVFSFSYRFSEGITASVLGWTRQLLEIAVLIIWPLEPNL